jgi:hypothetical protein
MADRLGVTLEPCAQVITPSLELLDGGLGVRRFHKEPCQPGGVAGPRLGGQMVADRGFVEPAHAMGSLEAAQVGEGHIER